MNMRRIVPIWRTSRICVAFILLLSLVSCLDEFQGEEVLVSTEGLLELTSEDVILLGRMVAAPERPTEIGFYVDTNAEFTNPEILISDDERSLGSFISSTNSLNFETTYFAKSYAVVGSAIFFGETISFNTNLPSLESFEPLTAAIGQQVVINGLNLTDDSRVFFGPNEAEITFSKDKSLLQVTVPDIASTADVTIEVVMQGTSFQFESEFTYHTGSWRKVSEYPTEDQLAGCVAVDIGDEMIIGYGRDLISAVSHPNLYILDKNTFEWADIAGPPDGDIVSDPINFKNGFGGGTIQIFFAFIQQSSQSWLYNRGGAEWVAHPSIDIPNLSGAIYANLGGSDYLFGGIEASFAVNRGTWSGSVETGEFFLESAAQFDILNTEAHFIRNDAFYYQSSPNVISEYNPLTRNWSPFFDAGFNLGTGNIAQLIGDKLYLGLGTIDRVLYEIDLETGEYIQKNLFTGAPDENNITSWVHNDKIYILRTANTFESKINGVANMELWEFDPFALK